MDRKVARRKYVRQKEGAKRRGIEWEFSFDSWLAWWGNDLDRRGVGRDSLQMQRFADSGPYAASNVRKGTPKDNAKTRGHMDRKRHGLASKAELEAARDAAEPAPRDWQEYSDDEMELHGRFSIKSSRSMFGRFVK